MTTSPLAMQVNPEEGLPLNRLWSVEEVAHFLHVPLQTVYGWRQKNKGPRGRRIGKHIRYRPADVLAWLEEQT
ncbi:helix-turn-helix domain-containing protein [Spirillospora sp. NPDC052269]